MTYSERYPSCRFAAPSTHVHHTPADATHHVFNHNQYHPNPPVQPYEQYPALQWNINQYNQFSLTPPVHQYQSPTRKCSCLTHVYIGTPFWFQVSPVLWSVPPVPCAVVPIIPCIVHPLLLLNPHCRTSSIIPLHLVSTRSCLFTTWSFCLPFTGPFPHVHDTRCSSTGSSVTSPTPPDFPDLNLSALYQDQHAWPPHPQPYIQPQCHHHLNSPSTSSSPQLQPRAAAASGAVTPKPRQRYIYKPHQERILRRAFAVCP